MTNKMFSKSLFISNIKRYWIIPFVVTIIIFLSIPFSIMLQDETDSYNTEYIKELAHYLNDENVSTMADNYGELSIEEKLFSFINPIILLIFPVIISIQIFKYLQKNKSATFIHGLPLNKKQIYITNLLCGVVLLVIPYIINFIVLLVIKPFSEIGEYILISTLIKWLTTNIFFSIIVYVFSNFAGILAGTGFAHGFITYAFMYLPMFFVSILESFVAKLIYGFSGFPDYITNFISQIPFVKMFTIFVYNSEEKSYLSGLNISYVLTIIAVLIVFIILTYILYKRRKLERAGEFSVFIIVKEILKYLATFLVMAISYLYCSVFIQNNIILLILSLIFAGIAYFISEVIMRKTYKVLNTFGGFVIYAVIAIILNVILINNAFGYETYMPNIDEIQYAQASFYNLEDEITYEQKENIQTILDLQKNLVDNKTTEDKSRTISIKYTLKNGKEINRKYNTSSDNEFIEKLEKSNEFIEKEYSYLFNEQEVEKISSISLYGSYEDIETINITVNKDDENFNEVLQALKDDITKLGVHINSNQSMTYGFLYATVSFDDDTNEENIYYNYLEDNCEIIKLLKNELIQTE